MPTTTISTSQCRRVKLSGATGTVAEIINRDLCAAKNVIGMLRWLDEGDRFDAESLTDKHQLIYLMGGDGVITFENKDYSVSKGAGIYLKPHETASIRQVGHTPLKLFHLIVLQVHD
jgi:hypothetical protein